MARILQIFRKNYRILTAVSSFSFRTNYEQIMYLPGHMPISTFNI